MPVQDFLAVRRRQIALALMLELCANICAIVLAFALAQGLAGVFGYQSFRARMLGLSGAAAEVWIAAALVLALGRLGFDMLRFRYRNALSEELVLDLRMRLFSAYMNDEKKEDIRMGAALLRFGGDMGMARQLLSQGILQAAADITLIVGGIVLICLLDMRLGMALTGLLFLFFAALYLLFGRLGLVVKEAHNRQASLLAYVHGALTGLESIRTLNRETRAIRQFEGKALRLRDAQQQARNLDAWVKASARFASYALLIGVIVYGHNRLATPDVLFVAALVALSWRAPLARLLRVGAIWEKGLIALKKFDRPESNAQAEMVKISPAEPFRLEVMIDNEHSLPSFEIKNNERLCIVAPAGSGKTTLVRNLSRVAATPGIDVFWNDLPAAEYAPRQLRKMIAFVSDAFPLTGLTLLDALRTNSNAAASRAAAACFAEWQERFPMLEKLRPEMRLRDLQHNLSATQCQLLQFVRADLSGRPLVVLDNPMNGLDDAASRLLFDFLEKKWADRAIILLSSTAKWEKIIEHNNESWTWVKKEASLKVTIFR
ncbi:MAG: ABC transporter transmembrane domain-containing protein [Saprospiraceae bacterium]